MRSIIPYLLGAIALLSPFSDATGRGLPWAVDNRYAPRLGSLPKIKWYHHWADGPVSQMPSKVEYVPMFWGPSQWGKWNTRKSEMNRITPKHLMAFNEPDIASQSNLNPYYAAQLYMEQINWWSSRGVRLGSPAIAWNLNWMGQFLGEVKKKGGRVDFICIHWYGSWADIERFKTFVRQAHDRFGKNIWITEVGITTSSRPTTAQAKRFMMNAFTWLDTQYYVERAAWFGAFETNGAPDSFATGKNAFFHPGGALTDMAFWYGYSSSPSKRAMHARHVVTRDEEDDDAEPGEAIHCDEICQLRNAQLDSYVSDPPKIDGREPEPEVEARDDTPEDM